MCGVAGVLRRDGGPADRDKVGVMTASLRHRGPDDSGVWASGPIALGNTRLSIIGIDERGHQPISNETGSVVVSYNGEIYNYRELRDRLISAGHAFRSATDTEVLVHGYEEWGVDHFLDRVNGIFAFALWDEALERLVMGRDRLGVKRLYVRETSIDLAFASEIAPLVSGASLTLNPIGVDAYFAFGYVPEPATIWNEIRCLPAGCLEIWEKGSVRTQRYWQLRANMRQVPSDLPSASSLVAQRLESAVTRQLVSDVPVGLFLSGGLDSMAVALHASKHDAGLTAFTVGFDDDDFDETARSSAIARHLGLPHHVERLQSNAWTAVQSLVRHMRHPFADSSTLAVSLVAALASKDVKVVLTGDGGDELFGGYETYTASQLAEWYRRLPSVARSGASWLADRLPVTQGRVDLGERARRFTSTAHMPGLLAHAHWREYFAPSERERLLGATATGAGQLIAPAIAAAQSFDGLDRYLAFDTLSYLPSDMLYKVDVATMWHSLEARVPFLDHELVEVAFSLKPRLKRSGMEGKRVLRESLKREFPPELLVGPKRGFNVPIARWLAGPLRQRLDETLASDAKAMTILDRKYITQLTREHVAQTHDHSYKLWAVLVFTLWYESATTAA